MSLALNSTTTIEHPAKPADKQQQRRAAAGPTDESHWRSVVKAISWRALGTVDTMVISFLITRRVKFALSIGCVELFTKVALFYLHERAWQRIPYGRVPSRPEE